MRATEFIFESDGSRNVTINIPITITIPSGGGDPIVAAAPTDGEMPPAPVNVFPLQQELELLKHQNGKSSKIINQILDDNGAYGVSTEGKEYDLKEDFDELCNRFNHTFKKTRIVAETKHTSYKSVFRTQ